MLVHSQHQFTAEVVKCQQIKISMKMRENFSLPVDGICIALLMAGVHFHMCWGKREILLCKLSVKISHCSI